MPNFVGTRSRNNDPDTSRAAAKYATIGKAAVERRAIRQALEALGPMTARQIAKVAALDYHTTQRRISETAGIERTDDRRDGAVVWRASGGSIK